MKLRSWVNSQMRKRSRVYILPTKMGGYLNGLIFLMFLLSVGYDNNLLLIFTLVLFGFNLIWVIQTHFFLAAFKLENLFIQDGHAGSDVQYNIFWKKSPNGNHVWQIDFESDKGSLKTSVIEARSDSILGKVSLPSRGIWNWLFLKVATDMPFGLYHVWIYFPLKSSSTFAYPELIKEMTLPVILGLESSGESATDKKGDEGIRGLAIYAGEESRRISWKHYARSGELFIKEGEELKSPVLEIEMKLPQDQVLKEKELSRIATQMVLCYRQQVPFKLNGFLKRGPGMNRELLEQCLKDLTRC